MTSNEIEPGAAAQVLHAALNSEDEATQRHATDVLYENAERFITPISYELPRCVYGDWDILSSYFRRWFPIIVGQLLIARPFGEWIGIRLEAVYGIIAILAVRWQAETETPIKDDTGAILQTLFTAFPAATDFSHVGIDLSVARQNLRSAKPCTEAAAMLIRQIESWSTAHHT